jgi:hypothetical protein
LTAGQAAVPKSLRQLQEQFASEEACADYLTASRWPGLGDGRDSPPQLEDAAHDVDEFVFRTNQLQ